MKKDILKSDADVPQILKMDGVSNIILDQSNKEAVYLPDLIKKYGTNSSWSHTLINSQSNSATLICQMPGEGNRRHFHPDWDEWWYIIKGEWIWEIEGVENKIKEEYRRFVKLADNKELKEEPLNIMNDVLELLKNLEESLHIFLEAERSNVEDTMLETVNLLVKAEQHIEKLKKMIK